MKRTVPETSLGIARAAQKMGEVATARAALQQLEESHPPLELLQEFQRVAALVAKDYEKEMVLGEGALLDLDHTVVKMRIRRERYPQAVLETARRHRSPAVA